MTTLEEKLRELIEMDEVLGDTIDAEAQSFLQHALQWPLTTQVPLLRVAYVMAGLMREPNPRLRRLIATDGIELRSSLG